MNPPTAATLAAVVPAASAASPVAYRRILLKLSGEALMGADAYGINREVIDRIVREIADVHALRVQIGIVIGGGNIFRGVAPGAAGMDRATADYMGMLATLMNALALQDALRAGVSCRGSSRRCASTRSPSPTSAARRCAISEHKVVIFAAGTGNPFFYRHRGRPARTGDGCRHRAQGDEGRRRVHGGP